MANRATPLVIAGPTASGKSGLALDLAEKLGGVIINADSMQLYADLAILTARPDDAALARAPHRLYGVLRGNDPSSAARWADLARQTIAAVQADGKIPILVGGTGLYLRTLLQGIAPVPAIPSAIRAEAVALLQEKGVEGLYRDLQRRDPVMAERLVPADKQRILRAWEVIAHTGQSLHLFQQAAPIGPGLKAAAFFILPPRDRLYESCDRRFLSMMAAGALAEVEALVAQDLSPDLPIMRALGVPELSRQLRGDLSLADAVAAAQQATRRYAKRQVTWFRHQMTEAHIHEGFADAALLKKIMESVDIAAQRG